MDNPGPVAAAHLPMGVGPPSAVQAAYQEPWLFGFFVLKNRLSCSPRLPPAQCMTEDNLGSLYFLPLPSKCSQTSPCQLTRVLLQLERTGSLSGPPAKSEGAGGFALLG